MKKISYLLLAIALIVLSGCGQKEINQKKLEEINEAYKQINQSDFVYSRYYGNYNEAYVFYIEKDDLGFKTVNIGGYTFSGSSAWQIIIYHSHEFYNLEQFDQGELQEIIKLSDVKDIYHKHTK